MAQRVVGALARISSGSWSWTNCPTIVDHFCFERNSSRSISECGSLNSENEIPTMRPNNCVEKLLDGIGLQNCVRSIYQKIDNEEFEVSIALQYYCWVEPVLTSSFTLDSHACLLKLKRWIAMHLAVQKLGICLFYLENHVLPPPRRAFFFYLNMNFLPKWHSLLLILLCCWSWMLRFSIFYSEVEFPDFFDKNESRKFFRKRPSVNPTLMKQMDLSSFMHLLKSLKLEPHINQTSITVELLEPNHCRRVRKIDHRTQSNTNKYHHNNQNHLVDQY